jgi:hypothetical protein
MPADKSDPATTLENLAARVEQLENQDHGVIGKFARAGIIFGCVGGLLGIFATARELWREVNARPDLSLDGGSDLDIAWVAQTRTLTLSKQLGLANSGEAMATIHGNFARLESDVFTSPQAFPELHLVDSRDKNDGPPVYVKPSDARTYVFTATMTVATGLEAAFPKEGLYKLVADLGPPTKAPDTYCFYLAQHLLQEIRDTGHGKVISQDARCSSDTIR